MLYEKIHLPSRGGIAFSQLFVTFFTLFIVL